MLDLFQSRSISRRACLRVGVLGLGGLTLPDLLRLEAASPSNQRHKAIIMVYCPGGPSHLDMYDMKPDAPVEIRGEFETIRTNVPGIDLCEWMPRQARIADKFSIVRGFTTSGGHDCRDITTGYRNPTIRPAFGSVVSRVQPTASGLPAYVSLIEESNLPFHEDPVYLGPAHRPLAIRGPGLANLSLANGVSIGDLSDRAGLLRQLDDMRRDVDLHGDAAGLDAYAARALDMVTSREARRAFDLSRETPSVRDAYGRTGSSQQFLLARRLVEAGVRVVTVCAGWDNNGYASSATSLGNWDTHDANFPKLRMQLPHLDQTISALISDLCDRRLDRDVAVVLCGEMGRAPRVGVPNQGSNATASGRDHWPTGFAFVAGGGLKMGQVVGGTDRRGERALGRPITPQNLLATMYHVLGIDPAMTFPDHRGRPQYLLDDRDPIAELL